jgi:biotin carboxylase
MTFPVANPRVPDQLGLLLLDGPGGPSPKRYLPRLGSRYNLHVVTDRSVHDLAAHAEMSGRELARHATVHALERRANIAPFAADLARTICFSGVLAFSELTIEAAHTVAADLGLPATSPSSLKYLRNKLEQRRALAAAGIPGPRFASVTTTDDLLTGLRTVGMPAVLKPQLGAGSMATFAIGADSDVDQIWEQARALVDADPRATPGQGFILESELVGVTAHRDARFGNYVSVESLISSGAIRHLGVCDKFPLSPPFRENGEIFPSTLPATVQATLFTEATRVIRAVGLDNTATHLEFVLTASGPVLIEINARVGGGVAEIIELASGLDLTLELAAIATGAREAATVPPPPRRYAAFLCPQPMIDAPPLDRVPSIADLLRVDGIVEAHINYRVREQPDHTHGTRSALMHAYAARDDVEGLHAIFARLTTDEFFAYRSTG